MTANKPAQAAPAKTQATTVQRAYASDQISDQTREILHRAIARGTAAAGYYGTPLATLASVTDPNTPEGKIIHAVLREAEKRAYSALSTWHRYALVESDDNGASIRTPAQLDPQTGQWGGIHYGLLFTGQCSCPDHDRVEKINQKLHAVAPHAQMITCKHFVIIAAMAAKGELILPDRAAPAPAITDDSDDRNQEHAPIWDILYHDGDPDKARYFALGLTHRAACNEAEEAEHAANQRPGRAYRTFFVQLQEEEIAPEQPTAARKKDF